MCENKLLHWNTCKWVQPWKKSIRPNFPFTHAAPGDRSFGARGPCRTCRTRAFARASLSQLVAEQRKNMQGTQSEGFDSLQGLFETADWMRALNMALLSEAVAVLAVGEKSHNLIMLTRRTRCNHCIPHQQESDWTRRLKNTPTLFLTYRNSWAGNASKGCCPNEMSCSFAILNLIDWSGGVSSFSLFSFFFAFSSLWFPIQFPHLFSSFAVCVLGDAPHLFAS